MTRAVGGGRWVESVVGLRASGSGPRCEWGDRGAPDDGPSRTPNYFAILGIRPVIGPGLPVATTDDTSGGELAIVIAHLLWEQLGGDTAMIGQVARLNGVAVRIVGVAPPKFRGAILDSGDPLVWASCSRGTIRCRVTRRSSTRLARHCSRSH